MSKHENPHDLVARIEARTNRILLGSGVMFLVWQISYFTLFSSRGTALRNVDIVTSVGFIAWCGALLMLLATGGGVFRGHQVREILDDERARAQRAQAYQNAFWAMMLVSLAAYLAAHVTAIQGVLLAHAILSAGVLVAVATLAYLNRR
jgi:hypothetical protein